MDDDFQYEVGKESRKKQIKQFLSTFWHIWNEKSQQTDKTVVVSQWWNDTSHQSFGANRIIPFLQA